MGLYSTNEIYSLTENRYLSEVLHQEIKEDFSSALSLTELNCAIHEEELNTFDELIDKDFVTVMNEAEEEKKEEAKPEENKASENDKKEETKSEENNKKEDNSDKETKNSLKEKIKAFLKKIKDAIVAAINKFINKIIELFNNDKKLTEKYYGPIKKATINNLPEVNGGKFLNGGVDTILNEINSERESFSTYILDKYSEVTASTVDNFKTECDNKTKAIEEKINKFKNEGNVSEKLTQKGIDEILNVMNSGGKKILDDLKEANNKETKTFDNALKSAEEEKKNENNDNAADTNAQYTGLTFAISCFNRVLNAFLETKKYQITTIRRSFILLGRAALGEKKPEENNNNEKKTEEKKAANEAIEYVISVTSDYYVTEALAM